MAVALTLAVTHNETCIVEILINHMYDAKTIINQRSQPLGRTLLHVAVRNNNLAIAKILLSSGADVNAVTDDGLTPLHIAIGNRSLDMVTLLLKFNVLMTPSCRFNGRTPLYMAVEYNCCATMIEMLINAGAKINETTIPLDFGALHLALIKTPGRDDRIADILIRHANIIDINTKSQIDGKTPLHLAIENGHYEMTRQLIKRGANVDESYTVTNPIDGSEEIRTPLSLAVRRGDEQICALLLRCGAKNMSSNNHHHHQSMAKCLHQAVRLRCKKIAELLLSKAGVPVDCLVDDKTPLQLAVECGYNDLIKVLLSYNASLEILGQTATMKLLYDAVKSNDIELTDLLLKGGVSVNAYVSKQANLLDVAVKARFIIMTKLLLKRGALIDEKSSGEDKIFALKYAVLALAEGQKIKRENRKLIRDDLELNAFYDQCRKELKRAKTEMIAENVTYFDMLTANEDTLASYAKRDELVHSFPTSGYRNKYKVYGDTIALNYAKGLLRNALLQKATGKFEKEFGVPLDSARYVFKLMNNADLQGFIKTFCDCDTRRHLCLPEIYVQF